MAGSAGKIFGSTRVQACVTALGGCNCQSSIGKDVYMSTVDHRPPLFVPINFRLGLAISYTVQADWLAQHSSVLHTRHTQHWWNWRNVR